MCSLRTFDAKKVEEPTRGEEEEEEEEIKKKNKEIKRNEREAASLLLVGWLIVEDEVRAGGPAGRAMRILRAWV